MFHLNLKALGLLSFSVTSGAINCYPPLYNYQSGHIPSSDSNLKVCDVLDHYSPHLSCCPQDATCLDNGLCITPSNSSLGTLLYGGCTYLSGYGPACPGADYCANKLYPEGSYAKGPWNVIPCSNGKYCCSFNEVSNDCCADEAETFEVSWGPIPDHSITVYSYVTRTTTVEATADCSSAPTTPVESVATPTAAVKFAA
ncbi:hypothetical protein DIS24_g12136 [Lasiodiplodia hormozganensis]|uniref:Secreted protein n=1 Tax=Lasiodiplodia hormozganensis TaxID=869390 RepID=A0AA39TWD6_9PEZI|nr:hypothetical protein DIS24_g12136 [Lasiodiplodia hormozganensis]